MNSVLAQLLIQIGIRDVALVLQIADPALLEKLKPGLKSLHDTLEMVYPDFITKP